jgi:c-di-GMP-binding flagellar brake protein YcgR
MADFFVRPTIAAKKGGLNPGGNAGHRRACYNCSCLARREKTSLEHKGIRKFPRIAADFPVEFTFDGKKVRRRATTLGGGGMYINMPSPPPVGTELVVRFRPARHLGFIETKAKLVYHGKDGAALEFLNIGPDEQRTLLRIIHHKTGNRRMHPRAKLATQVEWQGLSSLALSGDVSVGGMFIETTEQPASGSKIKLRFHLEDPGDVVVATGEVSYAIAQMGIGVRFLEMEPADRERIARYIAAQPAVPDPASGAADET